MLRRVFSWMPKKVLIFLAALIVLLIGVFAASLFLAGKENVPADFISARNSSSLIAKDIVEINNNLAKDLADVSKASADERYDDALNMIVKDIDQNRKARQKAVALSANLEIMIKNTDKIYPENLARQALEAISAETTLISHLITYNDYLYQLLDILRDGLLDKQISQKQVVSLADKINTEARAVNDINNRFNDLMKKFDGE